MTNEDCFEAWAPTGAVWSPWAKPVLFAEPTGLNIGSSARTAPTGTPPQTVTPVTVRDLLWLAPPDGRTALVIDLPGAESVATGLALARRGYRPVPLYNTSSGPASAIDSGIIARQLEAGAASLPGFGLRADAPPAFLLDAQRMTPSMLPGPGTFDNRWVVFPQDFPSGNYLRSKGVDVALLLHGEAGLQDDLAHVLLRWQQAGIRIEAAGPDAAAAPRAMVVKPPRLFRRAWYRALTIAGLRRNNAGGFGAAIPLRTTGGYG